MQLVKSNRMQRAYAIAKCAMESDEITASVQTEHEEDTLQAKQLANAARRAKRANEKYNMALESVVNILREQQPNMSTAERVITRTLIEQHKTVMFEAVQSVVSGGVNVNELILSDIRAAAEGLDMSNFFS